MVVSADPRNMAALTQFISSALFGRGYVVRVFCCFFLLKPVQLTKQPWAADPAIDDI